MGKRSPRQAVEGEEMETVKVENVEKVLSKSRNISVDGGRYKHHPLLAD